MDLDAGLSTTTILRHAIDQLARAGYATATIDSDEALPERSALAEDPFGIALIAVYETWSDLAEKWLDAQGYLVRRITESLSSANPKAWDGYLLLLTPAYSESVRAEDEIRYDTTRVRKLVGTGDTVRALVDLDTVLLPLLPLDDRDLSEGNDRPFRERLFVLLCAEQIRTDVARSILDSFEAHESGVLEKLVEVLHS
jgi:hypothetical protein